MRLNCLAFLVLMAALGLAGAENPPDGPFLVELRYDTVNFPHDAESTCLMVFPDRRFHMERWSEWPSDKPRIFEDLISSDGLASLRALLNAPELEKFKSDDPEVTLTQGYFVSIIIPRMEKNQQIRASAWDVAAGRPRKPFPEALRPLLRWTEIAVKEIDQRRLSPLKAKVTECWPKPEKQKGAN